MPGKVAQLAPTGRLPATNELYLSLVLPLRDRTGLENLVADISNPASPHFRQYLSPADITARFGPTAEDYAAVVAFAQSNHLDLVTRFDNRLVLAVKGRVADIESALHIQLRTYQHPTEAREFFAPDTEPAVEAGLPVVHLEGLNNYYRPHPKRQQRKSHSGTSKNGSSPDGKGQLFGNDFRNAYVPGCPLTGTGQSVGLFEWDGSYPADVAAYAAAAGGGRTNIALKYVHIGGFNGTPTAYGEGEVDLDIEMAMAIAPNLASIVVFEGNPSRASPIGILNSMAASNTVKNLSCSWGWASTDEPYTNTDAVFLTMAAQGQTFFNASGDSDAFTTGGGSVNGVDNPSAGNAPSSTTYITQVGGTTLGMNGEGASWQSEVVWDWGNTRARGGSDGSDAYLGSSGGISSYYTIPWWQTNVSNLAGRGGSTTWRNTPDVAACADNIFTIDSSPATYEDGVGGTSAAAPLWAGFLALVNQQLAAQGKPAVGFLNPALYTLGASSGYAARFHDVTYGSNVWTGSPNLFFAYANYDLCTGLGTMNGTNLINALAPPPVALTWNNAAGNLRWDSTSTNWNVGGGSGLWTNWDNAVFGGTGIGAVTVVSTQVIASLTVNAGGYSLAGGQLNLGAPVTQLLISNTVTLGTVMAGSNTLVKTGPGMLVLTATNTYTGPTAISNGTLVVNGALAATPVSVQPGAVVGGAGKLGGSLNLLTGAGLALAVTPGATNGPTVTGATTFNGAITVAPAIMGAALPAGTYNVLTLNGGYTGAHTFTWSDATGQTVATGFSTNGNNFRVSLMTKPVVATLPATAVTTTSATLNGTVNASGGVTGAWFQYGLTTSYGSLTTATNLAAATTTVSVANLVGSLTPGTVYHYQLVATNTLGTNYGGDLTWTNPIPAPVVTTLAATGVGASTATLNGQVNPGGGATAAWFQYGTTTNYGQMTTPSNLPATNALLTSSSLINGLAPGTAYAFQLVASNTAGTSFGSHQVFTTTGTLGIPPVTALLASGVFKLSFTNFSGLSFTVWATTNLTSRLANWTALGPVVEWPAGSRQYQFSDVQATNSPLKYYLVSHP